MPLIKLAVSDLDVEPVNHDALISYRVPGFHGVIDLEVESSQELGGAS